MIIEIRAKNCFAFNEEIKFSLEADMRSKKFFSNIHQREQINILKSLCFYGPNNVGKTCLVKCIRAIKLAMENKDPELDSNLFISNDICELGITFLNLDRVYTYDFKYDENKEVYVYEKISEIFKDKHGNKTEAILLKKDTINENYICEDEQIIQMIPALSHSKLLCYLVDEKKFETMSRIKEIITTFSSKIDIVNMNNIPIEKTMNIMKNENNLQAKVVNFIKNADFYLENFEYLNLDELGLNISKIGEGEKADEKALDIPEYLLDQMRFASTYKEQRVPSFIFDSTGTKKLTALAGYVVEALEQGRMVIVDELDSSLHFKITRAIVSMFNNELNTDAQMIFTVHDINLLDCKRMFRKEQICFVHKDSQKVYVYSLGDFTAQQGVRDTTDIIEKYKKGALGAIPNPELIHSILEINGIRGVSQNDE